MIMHKILCDRCSKEITEKHPPKMVSYEWGVDPMRNALSSYRTKATIHLCSKCEKEFKEFMKK